MLSGRIHKGGKGSETRQKVDIVMEPAKTDTKAESAREREPSEKGASRGEGRMLSITFGEHDWKTCLVGGRGVRHCGIRIWRTLAFEVASLRAVEV